MRTVKGNSINQTEYFMLRNSSDGTAKTGLAYNSAGAIASYVRDKGARVNIPLITQTVTGVYASGGFVEVDATSAKGLYRLDVPDAAYVAGVDKVVAHIAFTGIYAEAVEVGIDGLSCAVVTDAANTATTFKTDLTETSDGHFDDAWLRFKDNTVTVALRNQVKRITGYNGTTKFLSFARAFTVTPASGDEGDIINK